MNRRNDLSPLSLARALAPRFQLQHPDHHHNHENTLREKEERKQRGGGVRRRAPSRRRQQREMATASPVFLNVYDLRPYNGLFFFLGLGGIYHSGIEAHGVEFAYGGHAHACSGVFASQPKECAGGGGSSDGQLALRASIYLGDTHLSARQVHEVVARLGETRFHGNRYHLLQLNCNSFAEELAAQLVPSGGSSINTTTSKPVPSWVNRLAGLAVALHCLLPASWVPPLIMVPPPTGRAGAVVGAAVAGMAAVDCERQPLVGGGGGAGGGGLSSSSNGSYPPPHSALVTPPTGGGGMTMHGRGGAGVGGGAAAGALAAGSARRPGTAWPADAYEDVP